MKNAKQTWTWNWTSGGYNSCVAGSRAEALGVAMQMGLPTMPGHVTLVPDPSTLRAVTPAQMHAIDRSWASAFD